MESMPCCRARASLTKRQPMVVSWISARREKAASGLGMTSGARDIDSTPPATIRSASPQAMRRAAAPTASSPDAQSRLSVIPGTVSGSPAISALMRATLRLSSPAWLAQPAITSSTASPGTAPSAARMAWARRSSGRTAASAPP